MRIIDNHAKLIVKNRFLEAIRHSLVKLVPIIVVGALSLAIKSLPLESYSLWLENSFNGILLQILNLLYNATYGILALHMAVLFGNEMGAVSCARENSVRRRQLLPEYILVSVLTFAVFSGLPEAGADALNAKGMFTAIIAALFSTFVLNRISAVSWLARRGRRTVEGRIANSVRSIARIGITSIIVVLLNTVLTRLFEVDNIHDLITFVFTQLFELIPNGPISGLVFILISSVLWFFGIHGSDALENVVDGIFIPMDTATSAYIMTRPILDNFVLMGGCGTSICLLIALLIFARKKGSRSTARLSVFPAIFNINEPLVFGLPIVFNVNLVIPFILMPMISFSITYFAMVTGLVPVPSMSVGWTVPVIISGYVATNSIRGGILQLILITIGVALYAPFIRKHEHASDEYYKEDYEHLKKRLMEAEDQNVDVSLMTAGIEVRTAAELVAELQYGLNKGALELYYQPQYYASDVRDHRNGDHDDDKCGNKDGISKDIAVGAEALFRWNHPILGMIYPPMVFQLARESQFLDDMEKWVITRAIEDAEEFNEIPEMQGMKTSVNLTGHALQNEKFMEFLLQLAKEHDIRRLNICIELTEQAAFSMNKHAVERFAKLVEAGYSLAVDDFSMGSTSIKYLTENMFKIIKLDGSLVKQIAANERYYEIVSNIVHLCHRLDSKVVAEFVSDQQIRDKLIDIGCHMHQGWYYAPALKKTEYIERIIKESSERS